MSDGVIRLHEADNVVIALQDLPKGAVPGGLHLKLPDPVPRGHKLASRAIARGETVIRYGQIIGQATEDVAPGGHVHCHNLGMGLHSSDHAIGAECHPLPPLEPRSFLGYHRPDGTVGIRNYLGILTSVNCSGSVARFIAEVAEKDPALDTMAGIDGIVPIVHQTRCGTSGTDEGYQALMRRLKCHARNPNFGGILLVGLGREVMQVRDLVGQGRLRPDGNFRCMTIQDEGGTRATIDRALGVLREMAEVAGRVTRQPAPVSKLMVGIQCGGSDGYSGITANPALSHAGDLLVRMGGTTIPSETREIHGAEHLLTRRAVSREVGATLSDRIKWWEDHTTRNEGEMDKNPSPGNKRGGLTTILEKSLGAAAKGGTAPLSCVSKFAEAITAPGLANMDSPGYDPCSVTGQIASGATMIVFTTGRGPVSGDKPSPCIKLATNSEMYARMREDMDINCGDILDGTSIKARGAGILEKIVAVASGQNTLSEELGFGGAAVVPWQIGAVK